MATPVAPAKLTDLKNASEDLMSLLNGFKMGLIMKVARDSSPKPRTQQVITQVQTYIENWLLGPENVSNVGRQWASQITTAFRTAYDDCQTEVDRVNNNWSGQAADSFSEHADSLLARLKDAQPAVSGVATNLADLGANLGTLRGTVITHGADAAASMVNAAIQIGNTGIQGISPKMLAEAATGIGVPFAVVQYCMSVVAQISQQLTNVIGKLGTLFNDVNGSLQNMKSSATKMATAVNTSLSTHLPSEPPGLTDKGGWKPK
ncbi:hypothetical protein [Labedaea rhizosphaerae]|uniref:Uncharacterized protein n=1 Tax=Labedaea rhizosphaerae TaxID=598644 RepID=A0A4R6SB35_LABRH|nr:hypothetical protein [Labedaea rhizosphaerae]TDP96753.1 hypothetical protein EV186_104741 [Labedaea rhizosphaerae]